MQVVLKKACNTHTHTHKPLALYMLISSVLCILQTNSFIPVSKIKSDTVGPTADYPHAHSQMSGFNCYKRRICVLWFVHSVFQTR